MAIYANHWLYHYIPRNHDELLSKPRWQKVTWALFGNDDDGIFGEGPRSGHRWIERWGGEVNKEKKIFNPGKINTRRFLAWQFRNPAHNFTNYVIGFKGAENIPLKRVFLISTKEMGFCQRLVKVNNFPMNNHTGIYLGLHKKLPYISWRIYLGCLLGGYRNWFEGYTGWRSRGGFSLLSLRFKKSIKVKPDENINTFVYKKLL